MTPRPAVSVVMPTYKHRDFIGSALASVERQTYTDFEIVVVNDGSPDDTEAVLEPWIKSGRIRYVKQENQGQAAARNRGIELARGEFIALLDDDDLWPDDKLAWQVEFLRANPDHGLVGGAAEVIDADDKALGRTRVVGDVTFESIFAGNILLSPGQSLIRADALRAAGGFHPEIWGADDWDLYFRIARASRVRVVDRVALRYRKHAANASADMSRMLRNCCAVVDRNIAFLDPARRRPVKRQAYRYVYRFAGVRLRELVAANLRKGRIVLAMRQFAGFIRLVPPMAADPTLAWWFLKEFFPQSVRSRVQDGVRR